MQATAKQEKQISLPYLYARPGQVTAIYLCYWSLLDPLCQTQSLAYLRELTGKGYRFALITFEQRRYALDKKQTAKMKGELKEQGIFWYPLKYHKRFPLLATAYDCLLAVLTGVRIKLHRRPKIVHSRSSIPAAMALALSRLCRLKFLYDADARLSQEYVDNGHWVPESRAFGITAWVEEKSRENADEIITLSDRLRQDFIGEFKVSAPITVIPCCVDLELFHFHPEAREAIRKELQVKDEKLLIYVGKTGPRYRVEEMVEFFKVFKAQTGTAKLLIVSNEEAQNFHRLADSQGLSKADYFVRQAPREKVIWYLSAADAGLAFIRSAICERGSSPIKIGEYLATGLPVLITENIGDYSELIERERLGVVLKGHETSDYLQSTKQLLSLWDEGDSLKIRCRRAAETNLSLKDLAIRRYDGVYLRLTNNSKAG